MSITDLFVLGLGFDLAGAAILARGLLLGSASIADLGTWRGLSHGMTVERCSDRAHAELGLAPSAWAFCSKLPAMRLSLVREAGFRDEGGRSRDPPPICLWGLGRTALASHPRSPVEKSSRIGRAAYGASEAELEDAAPSPWSNSRVMYLVGLAQAAGWHPEPSDQFDSGVHLFVDRVFGIEVPRYLPMPEVQE